jgi:protein SCO1/2
MQTIAPTAVAPHTRHWPRRSRARLGGPAWCGAVLALVLLLGGCRSAPALVGTDLGGMPATDFALVDQDGQSLQLAALRGRPVVLTFLFTHCPDICPLTAGKLRRVADELGTAVSQVAFVAVSTDPEGDDAAAAQAFSAQHGLTGRWHFLLGSRAELTPVWAAYGVYAAPPPPSADPAERAAAAYAARAAVHTDAVYVLDKQGRQRTFLRSDFEPAALTRTLRQLIAE